MRLAVLGLGNMGRAFAAIALEKGHQVTVWNRSANRASDLVSQGAMEADTPESAVADSDVTLIVVADDDAVLSVCHGAGGVLEALPQGQHWPLSVRLRPRRSASSQAPAPGTGSSILR